MPKDSGTKAFVSPNPASKNGAVSRADYAGNMSMKGKNKSSGGGSSKKNPMTGVYPAKHKRK